MQYRTIQGIQRPASVLCMGTANLGVGLDESLSFDMLDAYSALGGNFLDTARVYGDFAAGIQGVSEAVIGRWLKRQSRDAFVIGTKGGHHALDGSMARRLDRESLKRDLDLSQDALDIETIDLYWLHRDDDSREVADILDTLNGFVQSGRVRALGASNWSPARIRQANDYAEAQGMRGFSAKQPQWSLAQMGPSDDTTLWAMDADGHRMHREKQLACVPFSSQAKGFFTKLYEGGEGSLPDKARARYLNDGNQRIFRELLRIKEETGASVGALALAFLTNQPFPVFPIVGVSRLSQIEALREAGDLSLRAEDLAALMALAAPK